jgi:hypothetical protein
MKKKSKIKSFINNPSKQIYLHISIFMLGKSIIKQKIWTISHVEYNQIQQKVNVEISTVKGKLGLNANHMTLLKHELAHYLFEKNLTLRLTDINIKLSKQEEYIHRLYKIIDKVV